MKKSFSIKYFLLLIFFVLAVFSCTPYNRRVTPQGNARSSAKKEPVIKVLLAEKFQSMQILLDGVFNLTTPEGQYRLDDDQTMLTLTRIDNGFELSSTRRILRYNDGDKIVLNPFNKDSHFSVNNVSYPGKLAIFITNNNLELVNIVPLEQYLAGVVPNEIPSSKGSYFEALKAQSVAARTYAIKQMKIMSEKDYQVYADHRDQVYMGILNHSNLAEKAIDETRGEVLFYQDEPIDAVFHSTSGGITEDFAAVWGDTSRPYLPVKADFYNGVLCDESPYYKWEQVYTPEEIEKRLFRWIGNDLPKKEDERFYEKRNIIIKILSRTPGRRVGSLSVKEKDDEVVLTGNKIRQFFINNDGRMLPSNLFTIEIADTEFVVKGRGFGHGVGLSQYSALKLAEENVDYRTILGFYYPNTELIKLY